LKAASKKEAPAATGAKSNRGLRKAQGYPIRPWLGINIFQETSSLERPTLTLGRFVVMLSALLRAAFLVQAFLTFESP